MFDFQEEYRFTWPVKVLVPTEDGQEERQFTGIFRIVPEGDLRDAQAAEAGNPDGVTARLALQGWKDDLVQKGKPLPYSEEQRDKLIKLPFVRYAVARAYWEAAGGALRQKN